jgi:hypothetical protein
MSRGIFGIGNVSASLIVGIGKEGEMWSLKLEEFSNMCDGVVVKFGKKLGIGEGFIIKKNSRVSCSSTTHHIPSTSVFATCGGILIFKILLPTKASFIITIFTLDR